MLIDLSAVFISIVFDLFLYYTAHILIKVSET